MSRICASKTRVCRKGGCVVVHWNRWHTPQRLPSGTLCSQNSSRYADFRYKILILCQAVNSSVGLQFYVMALSNLTEMDKSEARANTCPRRPDLELTASADIVFLASVSVSVVIYTLSLFCI